MRTIVIIGSVASDEVVLLDTPLRRGSHNSGQWIGKRIGGGAANAAMALARGHDRPVVVSALGQDTDGTRLVAKLTALGVDISLLHRGAEETTRSLILLEGSGERTVINLARASVPVPTHLADLPADCWYVRSADPALTPILAQRVRTGTVVAHVPPCKANFRPAQVLVGSASDLDEKFLAAPFTAGQRTAGAALQWVVITHGPEGAIAYGDGREISQKAPPVEVVDSTGAGDVFAAGLVHALAAGKTMDTALKVAVTWGSASVRYEGTVPPPEFPNLSQ